MSMIDTFMHGFERAGMASKAQFATDALRSAEHGGSALSTLLGPTAEGIDKAVQRLISTLQAGDAAAITNSGSIGADILPFATRLAVFEPQSECPNRTFAFITHRYDDRGWNNGTLNYLFYKVCSKVFQS